MQFDRGGARIWSEEPVLAELYWVVICCRRCALEETADVA